MENTQETKPKKQRKTPKKRIQLDYRSNSKAAWMKFCGRFPDLKLPFKEFAEIIEVHNSLLREYILETGDMVKLPRGFGAIGISKKKPRMYKNFKDENGNPRINYPIDWKKTKEIGRWVYHLNSHTDGYRYKWYWDKNMAVFEVADIYCFNPCATASYLLARLLKQPNSHYAQLYVERERNYSERFRSSTPTLKIE